MSASEILEGIPAGGGRGGTWLVVDAVCLA
jgi:hypothetical protein